MKTKLMVAAGIAAAGLMLTAVGGWVPLADAQDVPPVPAREAVRPAPQPVPLPVPRVARPPAEPPARAEDPDEPPVAPQPPRPPVAPRAPRVADPVVPADPNDPMPPPADVAPRRPQQRMEHALFDVPVSKDSQAKLIRQQEAAGWEFAGQVASAQDAQLVFKRPKGNPPAVRPPQPNNPRGMVDPTQPPRGTVPRLTNPLIVPPGGDELPPTPVSPRRGNDNRLPPRADDDELDARPAIIQELPSPLLPPRRAESLPDVSYPIPFSEPVRMIPPAASAEPLEIHVLELKNATPAAMSLHVKKFFDTAEVSIDEDSGSLVIRCGKKTLEDIKKLVDKLDKPSKRGGA